MKPHPRIRKAIKWGGAAVTVLLVVVWVGSCFTYWSLVLGNMDAQVQVDRGQLAFDWAPYDNDFGTVWPCRHAFEHNWWVGPWWESRMGVFQWGASIPLWACTALSLLAALAAWRLDTQARSALNGCLRCHYDRTGLAAGAKCPECGSLPAEPAPHA